VFWERVAFVVEVPDCRGLWHKDMFGCALNVCN
jgi:hypothetical protein